MIVFVYCIAAWGIKCNVTQPPVRQHTEVSRVPNKKTRREVRSNVSVNGRPVTFSYLDKLHRQYEFSSHFCAVAMVLLHEALRSPPLTTFASVCGRCFFGHCGRDWELNVLLGANQSVLFLQPLSPNV
ncbi:hypothetical protein ATANTOWER_032913 [Ataeniobius toweri]|uniref:Secreted protein n=1 Tax=Ataeniobius toweri TaxID=208326 RepID=A0ABU7AUN5_9TELE|nr:hypothetical protein [Ataeniobius toweri]